MKLTDAERAAMSNGVRAYETHENTRVLASLERKGAIKCSHVWLRGLTSDDLTIEI